MSTHPVALSRLDQVGIWSVWRVSLGIVGSCIGMVLKDEVIAIPLLSEYRMISFVFGRISR